MTAQDALFPGRPGLWGRVLLPDGTVHAAAWRDAIEHDRLVGTCKAPECGGYLKPLAQYRVQTTDWFPARCTACRNEVAHHGPRPAEKKTRRPNGSR
jgi:hypothetical protein